MRCFEMKCFVVSMVAALLVCSSAPARAVLIVADDFSYPDGSLNGKNGGTAGSGSSWSGAWTNWGTPVWDISGGQITASGGGNTANARFVNSDFDFGGSPATPLYFSARFSAPVGSDGEFVRKNIVGEWSENSVMIGLHWGRDDPGVLQPVMDFWGSGVVLTAGSVTADTEVLIVGKMEFNVDGNKERFQFWVDPTNVETSTQYSATAVFDIGWQTSPFIQLQSNTIGSSYMDDVRLGTTWADVGPVPEPSTLALLATGLIGLLCYAWRKRR